MIPKKDVISREVLGKISCLQECLNVYQREVNKQIENERRCGLKCQKGKKHREDNAVCFLNRIIVEFTKENYKMDTNPKYNQLLCVDRMRQSSMQRKSTID